MLYVLAGAAVDQAANGVVNRAPAQGIRFNDHDVGFRPHGQAPDIVPTQRLRSVNGHGIEDFRGCAAGDVPIYHLAVERGPAHLADNVPWICVGTDADIYAAPVVAAEGPHGKDRKSTRL